MMQVNFSAAALAFPEFDSCQIVDSDTKYNGCDYCTAAVKVLSNYSNQAFGTTVDEKFAVCKVD